jgi:hypothetical protein
MRTAAGRQLRTSRPRAFQVVTLIVTLLADSAFGAQIISQDVILKPDSLVADFQLTFNSAPDFFTVDSLGRQADSFQFFINPNASPKPFNIATVSSGAITIVRGEEIHVFDEIPVRDRTPPSPDPSGGGWGPIRGSVPFSISGVSVDFSVPTALLGITGKFSFVLQGSNYGALNYDYVGTSVPETASSYLAPTTLIVLFGFQYRRELWQRVRERCWVAPGLGFGCLSKLG